MPPRKRNREAQDNKTRKGLKGRGEDLVNNKSCNNTTSLFFCVSLGTFGVLCLVFLTLIYSYLDFEGLGKPGLSVFARRDTAYNRTTLSVACSKDYKSENFTECLPQKCGRVVMDGLVSEEEAEKLLTIAVKGFALAGSSGGASILNLHSGALSKGTKYIDIFAVLKMMNEELFTMEDFTLYSNVKNRIQTMIASEFNVPKEQLFLADPTFYSQLTTVQAKTAHDEYWHPHIDKVAYGSFHYTSLLYLNNYGEDFNGGRFIFMDKNQNMTVEPRKGRVSFFTSGSENVHYVEKLLSGTRYAITIPFTCDPDKAIEDPKNR